MSTVSMMTSLLTEDCFIFADATQNARSPTVRRRVSTARSVDDAERKRCRPGRSATCCRLSIISSKWSVAGLQWSTTLVAVYWWNVNN